MKQIFITLFVLGIACTIFGYFGEKNVKDIRRDTESKLLLLSEAKSVIWSEAKKEVRSTLMKIHFSPISKEIERSYNSIFTFGGFIIYSFGYIQFAETLLEHTETEEVVFCFFHIRLFLYGVRYRIKLYYV